MRAPSHLDCWNKTPDKIDVTTIPHRTLRAWTWPLACTCPADQHHSLSAGMPPPGLLHGVVPGLLSVVCVFGGVCFARQPSSVVRCVFCKAAVQRRALCVCKAAVQRRALCVSCARWSVLSSVRFGRVLWVCFVGVLHEFSAVCFCSSPVSVWCACWFVLSLYAVSVIVGCVFCVCV